MKLLFLKHDPVFLICLPLQASVRNSRFLLLPIILIAWTHAGSASAQNSSDSTQSLSFKPSNWSLGGSALWSDKDKKTKWSFEGDAIVRWLGPRDKIAWTLRAKYELENKETKENSRLIRIRWFHDLTPLLFTVVEGDLEKDNVELFELDEDYRLLQGSAGLGIRKAWTAHDQIRLGGMWNEFSVTLLRLDASAGISAFSVFLQSEFDFFERWSLTQWTSVLFWEDDTRGFDSEIEALYRISTAFSLGVRHVYRFGAATLTTQHQNEVKLFTRFTF